MSTQTIKFSFTFVVEDVYGILIEELSVDASTDYCVDEHYGCDADGNRGERQESFENVQVLGVYRETVPTPVGLKFHATNVMDSLPKELLEKIEKVAEDTEVDTRNYVDEDYDQPHDAYYDVR